MKLIAGTHLGRAEHMITSSDMPTDVEETIYELARHVRAVRKCGKKLSWTFWLIMCAVIFVAVANFGRHELPVPFNDYGGILLVLPFLPMLTKGAVENLRCYREDHKLRSILRAGYNAARQQVSSPTIGPLLDILAGTTRDEFLLVLMALLNDLLKSLSAKDAVVLTKDQRDILHALVLPKLQNQIRVCSDTKLIERERNKVRPLVIHALGLLGNDTTIPVLERFAMETHNPVLRQSALYSVGQITERFRFGSETMLRASTAPEGPDTLLRAALPDKPHDHDPQQLLRADNATSHPQGKNALSQTAERTMPD